MVKKVKKKSKYKGSPNPVGEVAYTPLSEKEKDAAMRQLVKDLHSGKKGGYRSPGGTRTNISDRH